MCGILSCPGSGGKIPEPVSPHHRPGLEYHPVPDPGPGGADHAGAEHAVVPDGDTVAEGDALRYPDPIAQAHIAAQHGVRADADFRPERTAGADSSRGIDARGRGGLGSSCSTTRTRHRYGAAHDDAGSSGPRVLRQTLGDQYRAGTEGAEGVGVAGRNRERQRVGPGPLQRGHRAHRDPPIAKQAATDEVGDRLRGEVARGHALRYRT